MAVRDPLDPDPARGQLNADARHQAAEAILGHRFDNQHLLAEALTHRSAAQVKRPGRKKAEAPAPSSNERLEFVGDRVLGLLIAEWLIERFSDEAEGLLARRQAHLVSREVLVEVAERVQLSRALAIGANEARAGVGQLANVLADAMEALLGALYLDGGIEVARRFVRTAWLPAVEAMALPPTDPKTALQEWLMARGLALPVYKVAACTGPPHAPEFVIAVSAGGREGRGVGGTKRVAERDAAADLLARLQAA